MGYWFGAHSMASPRSHAWEFGLLDLLAGFNDVAGFLVLIAFFDGDRSTFFLAAFLGAAAFVAFAIVLLFGDCNCILFIRFESFHLFCI